MTLISKEGASTSPVPGSFFPSTSSGTIHKDPLEPPSYSETISRDGPAEPQAPLDLPPASNYNSVSQSNGGIKGTWVVDTNIEVPPALRQSSGLFNVFREQENLSLITLNGSINASVCLVNGSDRRATIKAQTQNGKVIIKLSRNTTQPIKFSGTTKNGSVAIAIPRNFAGPIKFRTGWGNIKFSDAFGKKVATFSNNTAFVGNYQAVGFRDYKTWTGDEMEVDTSNGNISFSYIDEAGATFGERIEGTVEGAVRSVLGWFGIPS